MKNLSKLIVIALFGFAALGLLVTSSSSRLGSKVFAQTKVTPTPVPTTPTPTATATPVVEKPVVEKPKTDSPATTNSTIPKHFTLGKGSFSEHGEVDFNHDTHAFEKYSPDGKSVVGCVMCHHTDQPKSALLPPLLTSERDVVLTMESWQKSSQKVSLCRACHFQDGDVPDGSEMPTAIYKDGAKETVKELNNEIAYHINCNTCHDEAAKLRPEVKKRPGFATSNDCMLCHKEN